jgi:hypothetical protein
MIFWNCLKCRKDCKKVLPYSKDWKESFGVEKKDIVLNIIL